MTEVIQGGSIAGTVTYDGAAPEIATLDVDKNPEVCGSTIADPNATV
ncbi:MAG: hypothetical protein GWM93_08705, partial [Gemmatimonadetes bacterium]|nr:hypothetical protein [Gemmatimonadota bacterium]NIT66741.1 hypothetical protein [Gemmatimonadota bacterium]NIY35318.1 hypothetical protein [Gemmatimonadota bacterium]